MAHMNLVLEVIEEASAYTDAELRSWASFLAVERLRAAGNGCSERVEELSAMGEALFLVLSARGAL